MHIAFFAPTSHGIDENMRPIVVYPYRGKVRSPIGHNGRQVGKGGFLKQVKGVYRDLLGHSSFSSCSLEFVKLNVVSGTPREATLYLAAASSLRDYW